MNLAQLQDFFHGLVDDNLDEDLELALANSAKDEIEGEQDWEALKSLDETQSSSASDDYKTGPKTLPSDYLHTCNNGDGLYIGGDRQAYKQIPFEKREEFQNTAKRWYLDLKNSRYYVAATNVSGTHHHFYIARSADIVAGASSLWGFPSRYDKLIGYRMAKLFYAVDRGEKSRSWDDRWAIEEGILHNSLVKWNWRVQGKSYANAVRGTDIDSLPDAVSMRG